GEFSLLGNSQFSILNSSFAVGGWFFTAALKCVAHHLLDIVVGDQIRLITRFADFAAIGYTALNHPALLRLHDPNIPIAMIIDKTAKCAQHVLVIAALHAPKELHPSHPRLAC